MNDNPPDRVPLRTTARRLIGKAVTWFTLVLAPFLLRVFCR
jgi:hypothetical protein